MLVNVTVVAHQPVPIHLARTIAIAVAFVIAFAVLLT
jgi:hypothetical protein